MRTIVNALIHNNMNKQKNLNLFNFYSFKYYNSLNFFYSKEKQIFLLIILVVMRS
jgi:hypothetical protein